MSKIVENERISFPISTTGTLKTIHFLVVPSIQKNFFTDSEHLRHFFGFLSNTQSTKA